MFWMLTNAILKTKSCRDRMVMVGRCAMALSLSGSAMSWFLQCPMFYCGDAIAMLSLMPNNWCRIGVISCCNIVYSSWVRCAETNCPKKYQVKHLQIFNWASFSQNDFKNILKLINGLNHLWGTVDGPTHRLYNIGKPIVGTNCRYLFFFKSKTIEGAFYLWQCHAQNLEHNSR